MPSLEQRAPFEGEFKKPLVSTKDRAKVQAILLAQSDMDEMAWVEENADNVSRAFVQDPDLCALAKTDHAAAAAKLKWILAAMRADS